MPRRPTCTYLSSKATRSSSSGCRRKPKLIDSDRISDRGVTQREWRRRHCLDNTPEQCQTAQFIGELQVVHPSQLINRFEGARVLCISKMRNSKQRVEWNHRIIQGFMRRRWLSWSNSIDSRYSKASITRAGCKTSVWPCYSEGW